MESHVLFWCSRHHQQGRWQARIGRVAGNKDLYLGTFGKQIYLGGFSDIATRIEVMIPWFIQTHLVFVNEIWSILFLSWILVKLFQFIARTVR